MCARRRLVISVQRFDHRGPKALAEMRGLNPDKKGCDKFTMGVASVEVAGSEDDRRKEA
jgi:hypothetical protein